MQYITQKSIIIVGSIILVLLVFVGILYIYLDIGTIDPETGKRITINDYFPVSDTENTNTQIRNENTTSSQQNSEQSTTSTQQPTPQLYSISKKPVAGYVLYRNKKQSTSSSPTVRFISREKGHIYDSSLDYIEETKISNTTLSALHKTVWINTNTALLRNISNQNRYEHTLISTPTNKSSDATSTNNQLLQQRVTESIESIDVSPAMDRVVYINKVGKRGSHLVVNNTNLSNPNTIWRSPVSDWNVSWVSPNQITVTTKPSFDADGITLGINPDTAKISFIHGPTPGLTAKTNPSGSHLIYSTGGNNNDVNVFVTTNNTKPNTKSTKLPVTTLPEKCVWSSLNDMIIYCAVPNVFPNGIYPDDWYQGRVSFQDSIYRINIDTNELVEIANLNTTNSSPIDAVNLHLSDQEDYLVFKNKRDLSLWSLRIDNNTTTQNTEENATESDTFSF